MIKILEHPLVHFDQRPVGTTIDTLVIHSIYALGSTDELAPEACIDLLDHHKVAAHYLLDRSGHIWRLVDEQNRAWHAGVSKMPFGDDSRESVNAFSIGVELVATETSGFTKIQYKHLATLTMDILARHPIKAILGHDHIAPGRKTDPGPNFDWTHYRQELKNLGIVLDQIRFSV